ILFVAVSAISFSTAQARDLSYSIARGGRLYDNWYKVIGGQKPDETHPLWPASNTKKAGATTNRCKSCHGWDLRGADGAYGKGSSYYTGIKGLTAMKGKPNEEVIAILKGPEHGYDGKMDEQDFVDLANFVTKGQVDLSLVIDYQTKMAKGDPVKGESYYNGICAGCHGLDGKKIKDMEDPVGELARDNPWEIFQKIQNGQPKEEMTALRVLPLEVTADILAYIQKMPD
ncbi:MAG: c-type cytochrome, partial [Paracoccaceae bacterium]|nr:c-type cytochrome [Paracoccaceae bacterium]